LKEIEDLRLDRDNAGPLPQFSTLGIEREVLELVNHCVCPIRRQRNARKISVINQAYLKAMELHQCHHVCELGRRTPIPL
jgi:hypothetical protein